MNILSLLTKKNVEKIIKYSFLNFKQYKSYIFLDLIKCYGFFYATDSGVSISVEDLKVSEKTFSHLANLKNEILNKNYNWKKGLISEKERFKFIINGWSEITEDIKADIINYFEVFDPVNSLYIMSNSGARGNMSQVRQLIGVRGLMSDQEGNIIDIPVNASFKNGLNPVDYIISAYGARKGVVDTAVKTAAAGYLTRRLIFLARNIIIKLIDCKSKNGILIDLLKTKDQILYGYTLLDIKEKNKKNLDDFSSFINKTINDESLKIFRSKKNYQNLFLKVRSVLTCNTLNSLCQKCYGIDHSTNELITLGEVVGIIAAQSIGEPGTQLTMRTFHTGGVFSVQKVVAHKTSFIGKIFLKDFFSTKALKKNQIFENLKTNSKAVLYNFKGQNFTKLDLNCDFFPAFKFPSYIYNLDAFSEKFNIDLSIRKKKLQPVIANKDYKILDSCLTLTKFNSDFAEKASYKYFKKLREEIFYNSKEGTLMLANGEFFNFTNNSRIYEYKNINSIKKFAFSVLSSIDDGLLIFKNQKIALLSLKIKKLFSLNNCTNFISSDKKNIEIIIISHFEKHKFIDSHTKIISFFTICNYHKKVTFFEKNKQKDFKTNLFIFDVSTHFWYNFYDNQNYILKNDSNKRFLIKNGSKYKYYKNSLMLFPKSSLLVRNFSIPFIRKNSLIGYFITQTIQGNDIVQGIPNVSQIIEAIKPKFSAALSYKPGIIFFPFEKKDLICYKTVEINEIMTTKQINFGRFLYMHNKSDLYVNTLNLFNSENFNIKYNIFNFSSKFLQKFKKENTFDEKIFMFNNITKKLPLIIFKENIWICEKVREDIDLKKFNDTITMKYFKKQIKLKPILFVLLPKYFIVNYWNILETVKNVDDLLENVSDEKIKNKVYNFVFNFLTKKLRSNYKNAQTSTNTIDFYKTIKKMKVIKMIYDITTFKFLLPSSRFKYKKSFIPLLFSNEENSISADDLKLYFFNSNDFTKINTPIQLYKFLLPNIDNLNIFINAALMYIKSKSRTGYFDELCLYEPIILRQYLFFKNLLNNKENFDIEKPNIFSYKTINQVFKKLSLNNPFIKDIIKSEKSAAFLEKNLFFNDIKTFIKKSNEYDKIDEYIVFLIKFIFKYIKYILKFKKNKIFSLKKLSGYSSSYVYGPLIKKIYNHGKFVNVGEPISNGFINPHELLQVFYLYNIKHHKDTKKAVTYSANKFQMILLNSILAVYQSQDVKILLKHIEIMSKQLTNCVTYNYIEDFLSPLFPGEVTSNELAKLEHDIYLNIHDVTYLKIRYSPTFLSARKAIIYHGFLSSASFQNAKLVLSRAALFGFRDYCSGLKERVISGKVMNAGTTLEYINKKYKNMLEFKHSYHY